MHTLKDRFIWLMASEDSIHDEWLQDKSVMAEGCGTAEMLSSCWLGSRAREEHQKEKGHNTDLRVTLQAHPEACFTNPHSGAQANETTLHLKCYTSFLLYRILIVQT